MEDTIGWILVFALPITVGALAIYFVRRSMRKAVEAAAERAAKIDQYRQKLQPKRSGFESASVIKRHAATNTPPPKSLFTSSTSPTAPASSNDDWLTPALILATMNSHSGLVSAKVDDDTGSVTFKEEKVSSGASWSSSSDDDDSPSKSSSWSSSSSDIGSSSSWD